MLKMFFPQERACYKLLSTETDNASGAHMAFHYDDQHHDYTLVDRHTVVGNYTLVDRCTVVDNYTLVDRHTVVGNQCSPLQVMGSVNPRPVDPMVAALMPDWAQGKVIFSLTGQWNLESRRQPSS